MEKYIFWCIFLLVCSACTNRNSERTDIKITDIHFDVDENFWKHYNNMKIHERSNIFIVIYSVDSKKKEGIVTPVDLVPDFSYYRVLPEIKLNSNAEKIACIDIGEFDGLFKVLSSKIGKYSSALESCYLPRHTILFISKDDKAVKAFINVDMTDCGANAIFYPITNMNVTYEKLDSLMLFLQQHVDRQPSIKNEVNKL